MNPGWMKSGFWHDQIAIAKTASIAREIIRTSDILATRLRFNLLISKRHDNIRSGGG